MYTPRQYELQRQTQLQISLAAKTGLCAVCQTKPRSRWNDTGQLRMTCGDKKCFIAWLPVKGQE